jgi:carbamoyl-phosphate synthase small subunit
MKALLMLEDGASFRGETPCAIRDKTGGAILNTAVVGYQEMMTDPANAGKILVLTYPLIGNYGVAPKFNESSRCWLSGLVFKDKSRMYSNWQARGSLDTFVNEQKVNVITGVDTRTLAVHLRTKGEMWGIVSTSADTGLLLSKIRQAKKTALSFRDISTAQARRAGRPKGKYTLAILDLGITHSIIAQLESLGCALHIFPFNASAADIATIKPHGLIISNGPEGAKEFPQVASALKPCIKKWPILGISTGCQALAVALGAKTRRMKLGHRGVNCPIIYPPSLRGEITVQNHAWTIDPTSLKKVKDVRATAFNVNDQTIEEIESKKLRLMGVQYYPASPGCAEPSGVFKRFLSMLT